MKLARNLIPVIFAPVLALALALGSAGPALAQTDTVKTRVLVDTAWVLENLDKEGVRFVQLNSRQEDYEAGHLPGAVYLDPVALTNPDDPVKGQVATAEQAAAVLGELGLTAEDTIVLLDDFRNLLATRAYWVLKYYQHEDVRIYDGGTKKWVADGQTLVTEAPEVTPAVYEIGEADPTIYTTVEYVLEQLNSADIQFLDARSAKEYIGLDVRSALGGHIPGAINLDWADTVTQDGTFKSVEELALLFEGVGFDPDKQIVTYCQTGVRGAHVWFILRELLGYPDVSNYDGSWEEYGNNLTNPIQR